MALNPVLFERLSAVFKKVQISHEGEEQIRQVRRNLSKDKLEINFVHTGETYKVCCPFCNDTRFRCNINYMYGQRNELGEEMTHLAHCFNAGCPLSTHEREVYEELSKILTAKNIKDLSKVEVLNGTKLDLDKVRSTWPGKVIRIDKLEQDHKAIQYLRDQRGFDPQVLGKFYNVHWCYEATKRLCRDRIIIPIYHQKKMVGWQARAAFDVDWKSVTFPKYYTAPGTPKNHILYNLGNACNYRTGVIVEGVTDVWKVGPNAVCTLGASFSKAQQDLFVESFQDYAGILLYDPDLIPKMREKFKKVESAMKTRLTNGFCFVTLPEGSDPGSLDRDFIRNYISDFVQPHGMNIDWRKR